MAREIPAGLSWIDRFKKARVLVSALGALLVVAGLSLGIYVTCQSSSNEDPCKGDPMQENTRKHALQVMRDHQERLFRQPNFTGSGVRFFTGSGSEYSRPGPGVTGKWGILIELTSKKIDQSTLPETDRIPDCLDGVPVRWEEDVEPGQLIPGGE